MSGEVKWAVIGAFLIAAVIAGGTVQCERQRNQAVVECIKAGQGALECRAAIPSVGQAR